MAEADILKGLVTPSNERLQAVLLDHLPVRGSGMVLGLVQVAETAVFVFVLAWICSRLMGTRESGDDGATPALSIPATMVATAVAAVVFMTSACSPSAGLFALFSRWDHLLFCAATGLALSGARRGIRTTALTAISLFFLVVHDALWSVLLIAAGGLAGFAALRLMRNASAAAVAAVQGIVLVAMTCAWWFERSVNGLIALQLQGAFAYFLLRHISFVVEMRRGSPAGIGDYLCYMFLYTSFYASETFDEFSARNLDRAGTYDYRAAATGIVLGQLAMWGSFQIDITFEQVLAAHGTLVTWYDSILLFVRGSLFLIGIWSTIESAALLYGVVLRPNFTGILTSENPAQFWRAWRGTMTNWLIRYVYIPLGGNRRHQSLNILAAFAFSTAWHCMGVTVFARYVAPIDFAPVLTWGAINALAVIGYTHYRRYSPAILPAATPPALRRLSKIGLMAGFASLTVTLLGFRPVNSEL